MQITDLINNTHHFRQWLEEQDPGSTVGQKECPQECPIATWICQEFDHLIPRQIHVNTRYITLPIAPSIWASHDLIPKFRKFILHIDKQKQDDITAQTALAVLNKVDPPKPENPRS